MKTYFPYFFRKIGIVIVLVSILISMVGGVNDFARGFVNGYNHAQGKTPELYPNMHVGENNTKPLHYKGDIISPEISNTLSWIGISLSFVGLLLYVFSREKTEDELIRKLRYQSLEKSLIITWIVAFVFLMFRNSKLDAYSILQFQLFAYVVIYLYYKKKFAIR